jgi:hypothetical protein
MTVAVEFLAPQAQDFIEAQVPRVWVGPKGSSLSEGKVGEINYRGGTVELLDFRLRTRLTKYRYILI